MAETLYFQVVSPYGTVINTDVQFVVVPGAEGELGFLPNHAPLISTLEIGVIRYTVDEKVKKMAVSGGFVEVADNKVVILAETAELAECIDVARAQAAKARAEKRLQDKQSETDLKRADLALRRAVARLNAAS